MVLSPSIKNIWNSYIPCTGDIGLYISSLLRRVYWIRPWISLFYEGHSILLSRSSLFLMYSLSNLWLFKSSLGIWLNFGFISCLANNLLVLQLAISAFFYISWLWGLDPSLRIAFGVFILASPRSLRGLNGLTITVCLLCKLLHSSEFSDITYLNFRSLKAWLMRFSRLLSIEFDVLKKSFGLNSFYTCYGIFFLNFFYLCVF